VAKTMSATMMALRSRAVARRTFIVAIAKVLGDLSGDDLDKPSVDILFLSLHDRSHYIGQPGHHPSDYAQNASKNLPRRKIPQPPQPVPHARL